MPSCTMFVKICSGALLLKTNYVSAAVLDEKQFSSLNFGTYIELIKIQTVLIRHYFYIYRDIHWADEPNSLAAVNEALRVFGHSKMLNRCRSYLYLRY